MNTTANLPNSVPTHVAIIMDGNGRWAKKRFLPRVFGHRAGVEAVRKIVRCASDLGVGYLTLYAFSTENWLRPSTEVGFLMDLFKTFIQREKDYLHSNNVCVRFIGLRDSLPDDLKQLMQDIEQYTEKNSGLTLVLAINYGGRIEIADSIRRLYHVMQDSVLSLSNEDIVKILPQHMTCHDIPEPDLLIRTAGERRLSNFLLWHVAYSEFYFSDKLWPDFDESDLQVAFQDYHLRERRFGRVSSRK